MDLAEGAHEAAAAGVANGVCNLFDREDVRRKHVGGVAHAQLAQ